MAPVSSRVFMALTAAETREKDMLRVASHVTPNEHLVDCLRQ